MSPLPPPRRIVTSNLPLPSSFASNEGAEPAVQVVDESLIPISELGGQAARHTVFTHETVPTSNAGLDIKPRERGLVIPEGANIRYNDLAPGAKVPMHPPAITDYEIFIHGSVILLTPDEAYDPKTGKGKLRETICNPGDVVMQRGTLHAWENRSTGRVRFLSVMIGADATTVEIEVTPEARMLPDCFDA